MKDYLKHCARELVIVCTILFIFLFIFIASKLPVEYYLLGLSIITFILFIYFVVNYLNYQREINKSEQIKILQNQIKRLELDHIQYRKEMQSYFLTWVHQIKTPIAASKLLLESPSEQTVPKVRQQLLEIDNYTNLALSYLKLTEEQSDMVLKEVTIDELIEPIIKKYAIQFIHDKTKLHYTPVKEKVLTDANWSKIMIEQVINNALKYSEGCDVWIEFKVEESSLIIQDNGIGIRASDLPKVFTQGYSGYNGRLNTKSSGIGLYIAKSIAERMNHFININSTYGEGTEVTIGFH